MSVYGSRYSQAIFAGKMVVGTDGTLTPVLGAAPGADVTVRRRGTTTPASIYSARTMAPAAVLANPVPKGVAFGEAGLDAYGNLTFWAEAGNAGGSFEYEFMVTLDGETTGPFPIGTLTPDAAEPIHAAAVTEAMLAFGVATQVELDAVQNALAETYAEVPVPGTPDTAVTLGGTVPGAIPVVKPDTDTRAATWEFIHNSATGYLFHFVGGASFASPGYFLAFGLDNGDGSGLLIANKAAGKGIVIDQRVTVTATDGYGIHATQRSPGSPLVRLEMQANDAADLMQLLAFGAPGTDQKILYVGDATGEAGRIYADNGRMRWRRDIEVQDKDGTTRSIVKIYDQSGVAAGLRSHAWFNKRGVEFYSSTGTSGSWWPFTMYTTGSRLRFTVGPTTATVGTPGTLTNVLELQADGATGKLAFFNATPVAKPTGVAVTAAGIHAALVSLGLIAA